MPDDGVCWIPAPLQTVVLLIARAGAQLLHIHKASSKENPDLSRGYLLVSARAQRQAHSGLDAGVSLVTP